MKAASTLLKSKGLPAFNMNAVAALAAVDVPLLHKHYKDRTTLLAALYKRAIERGVNQIFELIQSVERLEQEGDTIALVHRQIDRIVDMQLAEPDLVALRQSIRAVPELAEVDERLNEGVAHTVEQVLRSQLPEIGPRRARSVAVAVVEAGTALVELCARRPKDAKEISREIGVMIIGYMREIINHAAVKVTETPAQ